MPELSQLPGIGPKTLAKLSKLSINSSHDLLYHFPFRYIDFSHSESISGLKSNQSVTITGKIVIFQNIYTRQGKNIQKAVVADKTGTVNLIWFNQPYLSSIFKVGSVFSFAGNVTLYLNKNTIIAPEFGQFNTGGIIAVYPETAGLSSKWFRKTIQTNLTSLTQSVSDPLPSAILKKYSLVPLRQSLFQIHHPQNQNTLEAARLRLSVDEILSLQTQSYLNKLDWSTKKPQKVLVYNPQIEKQITAFIKALPFQLTGSQKKVWTEILSDLCHPQKVSNRLLAGDVGSGKTAIAMLAAWFTSLNQCLTLIVAPTEILASQHFRNFKSFFGRFNSDIYLLTAKSKINIDKIPDNSIIISTHAAIYQKTKLINRLGLLVIDEQHKFGVKQRSFLSSSLHPPHCLTMTATPIPRTISLTLLGNIDLSVIETPPQNRLSVKTFLVPQNKIPNCYQWLTDHINNTHSQAFIVCPFIEVSETLQSVKSAVKEFEYLSQEIFPQLKLALIHGKTPVTSRQKVLNDFNRNQINILVTTPIIEVGIDIPNTSVIVIQSADRFGLAQLHQLRGRVGRSQSQSYCYLFTQSDNQVALNRLKFLETNHNGLKIAEYDLKTRGPGEIFSTLQHGFPSLKIADLSDISLSNLSQKILHELISLYPNFNLSPLIQNPQVAKGISPN